MFECGVKLRYQLTLFSGLLECLCFTGVVYGWASLVFVLKREGYFSELCVNATGLNESQYTDCTNQDNQLSLVFTTAAFSRDFLRFPVGFIFDAFGTLAIRLIAIFLYVTGTFLITVSSAELSVLLFPSVACLLMSGMIFYITNTQVGNLFKKHRSAVITVYAGAFESSAAMLLVVKVLYESGISLHISFFFLCLCGVLHLLRSLLLMPSAHIPYPIPENYTYGLHCCYPSESLTKEEEGGINTSDIAPNKEGAIVDMYLEESPPIKPVSQDEISFMDCVFSKLFFGHLLWFSLMLLRQTLFISTLNPTLNRLSDEDSATVSKYTNAFAIIQFCGVLFAPWNGFLMDRQRIRALTTGKTEREADLTAILLSLFLTSVICFLFSLCISIPVLPLQYVTFALQVISSSCMYGGHAAFINIAFPIRHFGKLSGMLMSLASLVQLLQMPLLNFISERLHGDPLYVNVGMTLLSLVVFIHPLQVYIHCRGLASKSKNSSSEMCRSLSTESVRPNIQ
ncbi:solute carrier family 43 member 3-like [Chanos chanos]|uniref:Solute carrier family 43 member 3-like n=1 Tax=Chanos chanos TaxID=29144 RepID=A0A6J2WH80_CHACN|nr:solute carrier family 43 member 3-like [Chanos chanos]